MLLKSLLLSAVPAAFALVKDHAASLGGLQVGSANVLVPDASAEHPLIISRPEDQPLCSPSSAIASVQPLQVMEGYEAYVISNTVESPGKILVDHANHLLVASPAGLYSLRIDKCSNADTLQVLDTAALDGRPHGIALDNGHLYVSTANSVYRYGYTDGQHTVLQDGVQVLSGIHPQRSDAEPDIAIDPFGLAYLPRSVAELNSTVDAKQAVIKRFNFREIPAKGYNFDTDGEIYALGTNAHGSMAFDAQARLWGIDAPVGRVQRADIGGDDTTKGLAEEINLFEFPMQNYGFPFCFTEYNLKPYASSSRGIGAQWAHPTFMKDDNNMDDYCQKTENNQHPAFPLPSGSHATSLYFYMGTFCSVGDKDTMGTSVGLPCSWTDTPIVAFHGTNGQPEGHSVVRLHFDDLGHQPRWDKKAQPILSAAQPCAGAGCFSPVGLSVDSYGRLLVSSDETSEIYMVHRVYNALAAQMLTDRDNNKEAAKDAAEEAKEEGEEDGDDTASKAQNEKDEKDSKGDSKEEEAASKSDE